MALRGEMMRCLSVVMIALFLWQSGALALPPPSDAGLEREVERLNRALALREEGEALLQDGDEAGALERFRQSLAIFPDESLEKRVWALEERIAPRKGGPLTPPGPTRGEVALVKTFSRDGGVLAVPGGPQIALDPGTLSGEVTFSLRPAQTAPLTLVGGPPQGLSLGYVWDVDLGGAALGAPARISFDLPREA